ncbi:AbrB/MazE/SpoVT family DNA-binding domain-containing protein [Priestia aryabhattai]|uniref:AbrB/MazE/SpoVT family DNA-binding domain-containing protein n=1 Tax=Priestia aryabhattai TaxID=412384 RepID=UPI001C0B1F4B|nr:AbrB/MazE/SpoVT family DNA-binding domain-containing protein [Priestia aryabhattai]MBU3570739.1 AbrB/MazE/SpoVT family DNA-binding domain-containing protein [Priestia aryabhattai]
MKDLGFIRKLDELGRITIPKEVRDEKGWKQGQTMEISMCGNELVIKSYIVPTEKLRALEWLQLMLEGENDEGKLELVKSTIDFVRGS